MLAFVFSSAAWLCARNFFLSLFFVSMCLWLQHIFVSFRFVHFIYHFIKLWTFLRNKCILCTLARNFFPLCSLHHLSANVQSREKQNEWVNVWASERGEQVFDGCVVHTRFFSLPTFSGVATMPREYTVTLTSLLKCYCFGFGFGFCWTLCETIRHRRCRFNKNNDNGTNNAAEKRVLTEQWIEKQRKRNHNFIKALEKGQKRKSNFLYNPIPFNFISHSFFIHSFPFSRYGSLTLVHLLLHQFILVTFFHSSFTIVLLDMYSSMLLRFCVCFFLPSKRSSSFQETEIVPKWNFKMKSSFGKQFFFSFHFNEW